MIRNVIYMIILVMGLSLPVSAQFALQVDYIYAPLKSKSVDSLLTKYNSLFTSDLVKPFDSKVQAFKGPSINVFWGGGSDDGGLSLEMGMGMAFLNSNNTAVFPGGTRHLNFTTRDWNMFEMAIGLCLEENKAFWHLNASIRSEFTTMELFYEYSDGTISYASEKPLNGIYNHWRLTGFVGSDLGVKLYGPILLVFRTDYVFKQSEMDKTVFQDREAGNLDYIHRAYNDIYNDFYGFRYSLGIRFAI